MEVVSIVLSVVAVFISIAAIRADYLIARTDLKSNICSQIFDEYLIKNIPTARKNLKFGSDGKLNGSDNLCRELLNMLVGALFYQYDDEKFYTKLRVTCLDLQDYLTNAANTIYVEEKAKEQFYKDVHERIEKIYLLVDKKRVGK